MIDLARRITGWVALGTYLVTGAILYFVVIPGANGLWPPDFALEGYDVQTVQPFVDALSDRARDFYARILTRWDRLFAISLAVWFALTGWRGGGLRYLVAGLAVLYALVDLAENAAIWRFTSAQSLDPALVRTASHLTMAKFATFYLCAVVLVWHLRRER